MSASIYRCTVCGAHKVFVAGNHHPRCDSCHGDYFDWGNPVGELTARELAFSLALEKINVKAEAGLCYFTLESAREFLKDIRNEVADALGHSRVER